jgi:hypothetical protein
VAWSELVLTTGSAAAMLLPVTGSPPVGTNMASSKRPPLGALAAAKGPQASPARMEVAI